jgi:hypothetical protein
MEVGVKHPVLSKRVGEPFRVLPLFFIFSLLFLVSDPLLLIDQALLPLDVFEHVLVLRDNHIVGEDLRVFFIKIKYFG